MLDDPVGRRVLDALAAELHAARRRADEAGDDVDGGALPGRVGADDRDDLAFVRLERDAEERLEIPLVRVDVVQGEQRRHASRYSSPR
jgi:hypothetical protein